MLAGQASEKQPRRSDRKGFEVLNVFVIGPRSFITQIRIVKSSSLADAATVPQSKCKQIVSVTLQRLTQHRHGVEVEDGVAIGLGARKFFGKASIGGHLLRSNEIFVLCTTLGSC